MLRDVRSGAVYTITDHGEPVAEVAPAGSRRWVPAGEVADLLSELGRDEAWAHEIAENRAAEPAEDPWERAR